MSDFSIRLKEYVGRFEKYLSERYDSLDPLAPQIIKEAMRYAVKDGGKRVRPVLCFAATEMLGVPIDDVKEFALAIETIHSYSLVHDDLPAMDDDDYRRGKLSTHKKFGEANGILAGDALLNFAFEICLSKENITANDISAMREIADAAGYRGMIAGQVLDLESENADGGENRLYEIYTTKTGRLITAPLLVASCVAGKKYYEKLKSFGYHLGITFQITDDIMDVEGDLKTIGKTPHKDAESGKFTSIKVFGLDGAKARAEKHYNECKRIISEIPNGEFLSQFADAMYVRKS